MAAASYHPFILRYKYEQTANVKPLTAACPVCGKMANLDVKVSIDRFSPSAEILGM